MADSPWREALAEWQGEGIFIGSNARGGRVQMGSAPAKPGISPMELLLAGVAGCTGMDVASILKKKRQPLQDFKVRVRGKRAESFPQVFTEIEVAYYLWGVGLDPVAVERAIELSEEKYCSASAMLRAAAKISSQYFILTPGEPAPEFPDETM